MMTDKTPQSEIVDTICKSHEIVFSEHMKSAVKLATINASRTLCHKLSTKYIDGIFDIMVEAIMKEPETNPVLEELAKNIQVKMQGSNNGNIRS